MVALSIEGFGGRMITDRRSSKRFAGQIGIISSDEEGLNFAFIKDLSRDGAYIETQKLVPAGAKFSFVVSNGTHNSAISSRVVRIKDAFFEGGASGFGVSFEGLEGASKKLRDDLILYLMNQTYQSQWVASHASAMAK